LGCFEKIDIVGVYVGCEQSVGRAILVGSPPVFTASSTRVHANLHTAALANLFSQGLVPWRASGLHIFSIIAGWRA